MKFTYHVCLNTITDISSRQKTSVSHCYMEYEMCFQNVKHQNENLDESFLKVKKNGKFRKYVILLRNVLLN